MPESMAGMSAQFANTDWDFASRVAPSPIEAIHPYPAKFVAELPRRLLDLLPVPRGTAVLDPFCGSGTTLVECQRRGLPAIGVDLNPIACLISRVKTAPLACGLAAAAGAVVEQASGREQASMPDAPRLDHWFAHDVQLALAGLTAAIGTAPASHRDALRLALSSIVVRVSNQESDTRYAAICKNVRRADVLTAFHRAAERIERALGGREYALAPATVVEADITSVSPAALTTGEEVRGVGLVITSPPYPNAYEYWLYHKYRMYWLGMDPLAVKAREIGARAHFFKRNPHTADDFARQMKQTLGLLRAVLVRGGYVCFVIGRSRIHGEIVDNAAILEEVGRSTGFVRVCSATRTLATASKSFNPSYAGIKKEIILVLKMVGRRMRP